MRAPAFWWRPQRGLAATFLAPLAFAVGTIAVRRMRHRPRTRLPVPVVCVGNPTVGGAGKTPVAIALALALAERGARPVFLTRGYRGRLAGPVLVTAEHTARDVGDEPLLLAAHFPTIVSADRAAGGLLALAHGDVVVMDDGFQNPALAKDCALLVVDAAAGLGNRAVTPAGPLRAPLAAQLPRADAIVVVEGDEPPARPPCVNRPVFTVRLRASAPSPLDGVDALAFAGIGRPEKFFASAEALGARLVERRAYGDHAAIGEGEAARLRRTAAAAGLTLLTTAKDRVRLEAGGPQARALAEAATVIEVRAELPGPLVDLVANALSRCARQDAAAASPATG